MKIGRTLSEVAAEIERQAQTKHDYIADTRQLRLDDDGHTLALDGHGIFETKDLALTQIGAHAGIPVPYMRRMQTEAPALLARNVNHWFQAKPAQRMVRTLDGGARAFLSSRYARIDNLEVVETVLPVLSQVADRHGGMEVVSTEVTENRLYIKTVFPMLRQDEKSSVLRHLIEGGDLSRFGLMNAVTRTAEDVASYDRATELEALGGAVVDLTARDWHLISTASPLAVAA
jgi:hypothetical protein